MTDAITQSWVRNRSDELAVEAGCRFNEGRGRHVLEFSRKFLRLYEGDLWAGKSLEPMPWQAEVSMRLFGWERWNDHLKRWVRRFRKASIWVPKKNAKSPSLAWWSLYLLCADGESGQKVYFGAKDGAQAREIAGKHAIEMVLASAELSAECVINKSLMQITHVPTRSLAKPISSGDTRIQAAKEGLNGCVCIDETHVVDREFMGRIARAGISRSEPLIIEVSTAGDDPEGYGKEQYDKGKRVECGDEVDERFFFVSYEAPQELKDEDLAADPAKYGQMANPAWGITIDPAEFLADYHASKANLTEFSRFKKYRLNIWQQSSNPWLDMGDWQQCKRAYTEDDLLGLPCYGAFDLSKTRDTTALVLIFPGEARTYRQWAYVWLPKDTAAKRSDLVPYQQWAKDGHLTLIDGNEIDFGFVRQKLLECFAKFELRKVAYDTTYAAQMVQRLIQEDGVSYGKFLEFRQRLMDFTAPTVAYENQVHAGLLHHPGNPLFTWQAGNVRVKADVNGNIRPVKQKHGDYRTIDAPVAGIMALALAMQTDDGGGRYYEDHEVETA